MLPLPIMPLMRFTTGVRRLLLCALVGAVCISAASQAADSDYAKAQYYRGATGQALDLQKYAQHLEKSARNNNAVAQAELGFLYYNGNKATPRDLQSSFYWFDQAARNHSVVSKCMLGDFYRDGVGGAKQDYAKAFALYKETATQKDRCSPKSQYELYVSYDTGRGVRRNPKEAIAWLKRSAQAGNPKAQYTLGRNYSVGHGVDRDPVLAKMWMKKSREGVAPHDDEEEGAHHPQGHHHH